MTLTLRALSLLLTIDVYCTETSFNFILRYFGLYLKILLNNFCFIIYLLGIIFSVFYLIDCEGEALSVAHFYGPVLFYFMMVE